MKQDVPTPYLDRKGLAPRRGAFLAKDGKTTCIPAVDADGKLWSMQYIQEDGTKRFAKNSRKEGCFHPVGGMDALRTAPAIVIAEGYATAGSISDAIVMRPSRLSTRGILWPWLRILKISTRIKP